VCTPAHAARRLPEGGTPWYHPTTAKCNVSAALHYTAAWLGGRGAVLINNLMEDAATAQVARARI
jgi:malate synthase